MGAEHSRTAVHQVVERIQQVNVRGWVTDAVTAIEENENSSTPSREVQLAIVYQLISQLQAIANPNFNQSQVSTIDMVLTQWVNDLDAQRKIIDSRVKLEKKRVVIGGKIVEIPYDLLTKLDVRDDQQVFLLDLTTKGEFAIQSNGERVSIRGVSDDFLSVLLSKQTTNVNDGNVWYCGWVDGNNKLQLVVFTDSQYRKIFPN